MNSKYKGVFWVHAIFLLVVLIATYIDFKSNYVISGADTFFHAERIYEIRNALKNGSFPGWLNFMTFHHVGQAINGMYPDISLWPLVYITNKLSPIHQIIIIRALILILTFFVSYVSISKRFDKENASYVSAIYSLSGMCLRIFNVELQLGTAVIFIFLFPIAFNTKDIIYSDKIDIKLILNMSLLCTIVIYSHLMSIFVLYVIIGIGIIGRFICYKKIYPIVNTFIASLFLILTSLPVLFRYYIISKAGIQAPFSKNSVTTIKFIDIFSSSEWSSRTTLSIVTIVLLFIVISNFKVKKLNLLLPYLYGEITLIVLGTNLAPWSILQNLPLFDSIQNTGWRFMIFSGVIPFILLLINFSRKSSRKILKVLFIIAIFASMSEYYNFHQSAQKNLVIFDGNNSKSLGVDDWVKLKSTGINSAELTRDIIPDYAPKQINSKVYANGSTLSEDLQNTIKFNQVKSDGKNINTTMKYTYEGVEFNFNNVKNISVLELPVYGYKTLNYHVTVNGKDVPYAISNLGFIKLNNVEKVRKVSIKYLYPEVYKYIIYFSTVILLILVGVKVFYFRKMMYRC